MNRSRGPTSNIHPICHPVPLFHLPASFSGQSLQQIRTITSDILHRPLRVSSLLLFFIYFTNSSIFVFLQSSITSFKLLLALSFTKLLDCPEQTRQEALQQLIHTYKLFNQFQSKDLGITIHSLSCIVVEALSTSRN